MRNEMEDENFKEYVSTPIKNAMRKEYDKLYNVRCRIINELKSIVEDILVNIHSSPVVSGRIKNFSSYFFKYIRLLKSGITEPKIMDLMGIRIICPFIEDLSVSEILINKNFNVTETERKGHYTFKEFGYESTHLLVKIPAQLINKYGDPGTEIVEIQIRTILQDAWAEVEHELVYKAEFSPFDEPMRRKLAAVNASLSLADIIFQEIRSYQRKYSRELEKRRESFYNKIEESTDELLFIEEENQQKVDPYLSGAQEADAVSSAVVLQDAASQDAASQENASIDDLLVNALTAHNENRFNEAINQYSKILELKPNELICSIIYKHRGMANFACSNYNEAIKDFSASLELDNKSYKAAYYRGVVNSVLKQYEQAIDDYTLALTINPYQSFCLFRRGQAFYHMGDLPHALSDCEKSLSLEPGNNSAEKFKAMLLNKLKM